MLCGGHLPQPLSGSNMLDTNMRFAALPLYLLRKIEFQFARSRRRLDYWQFAQPRSALEQPRAAAIGLFLRELLDFRATEAIKSGDAFGPIHAQDLVNAIKDIQLAGRESAIKISQAKMSMVLRGVATGTDPFSNSVGASLVRLILLGTTLESPVTARDTCEGVTVAERITSFFFPRSDEKRSESQRMPLGFFEPQFQNHAEQVRTAEAISEIYALAYATDPSLISPSAQKLGMGKSTIVRTSGHKRFVQVAPDGTLTSSGYATINALAHGVEVWFLYPKSTEAERSAKRFSEIAKKTLRSSGRIKTLHLKRIQRAQKVKIGTQTFWSSDYLSRVLRFVYHECTPAQELNLRPWTNLMMSRAPRFGPCAWSPTADEIDEFAKWFHAIRGSQIPETKS
jgi:hypothetical protein